jgi:small GTP-binding protein
MTDGVPHYKIVLLGDTGVGKTALVDRISNNVFAPSHVPTVGAQFVSLEVRVEDKPCVLELWDTAGQEVFRSLVGFYAREAKGCFILFDLTKQGSYNDLSHWIDFVQENAPSAKVVIFGNKKDIVAEREVPRESAEAFAASHHFTYFEGSAKTAEGVSDAFDKMAELVFSPQDGVEQAIVLTTGDGSKKKRCC